MTPEEKEKKGGKFFNLPKSVIAGENQTEPGSLTELARGQRSEERKHLQSVRMMEGCRKELSKQVSESP